MQQQLNNILSALAGGDTQAMNQIGFPSFLFLMLVSLASSFLIAYLYTYFYSSRATGSQVHRAFPLLGISITAIFLAIQFSLPLSLGLLGALSIVRFRTPIKEPEEIGFIMLVIAAAIACATFKLMFLGIILLVAVAALLVQALGPAGFRAGVQDGLLVISLPAARYEEHGAAIAELLRKRLSRARLESLSKNDGQVVLSYNFNGLTPQALLALEGELQQSASASSFNVFFNRPGAL
jgi:hypothetical protein